VVDFIEAGGDVALDHPLIASRSAGEMVDLGDGVLGAPPGAEPIGAGLEIRLEDRLQHQLERGLHHPVGHGRDAQPALAATGLGDQPLPSREGTKPPGLQLGPQVGEEAFLAPHPADVQGGPPVHARGARALVPLDPTPCHQQERRIPHEVEQIIEPATGIVGCPMVQLGLDSQYPRLRLLRRRPRRVGIHQRPPGLPVLALRARCRPWPCGRLSRPRTTTAAPPHPGANSRQRTCPPPAWPAGGEGSTWAVPTFVLRSVDGGGGQLCPSGLATGTPQTFPVASWPALTTGIRVARSRGRAPQPGPYLPGWSRFFP
jgi:hypothetical protein